MQELLNEIADLKEEQETTQRRGRQVLAIARHALLSAHSAEHSGEIGHCLVCAADWPVVRTEVRG